MAEGQKIPNYTPIDEIQPEDIGVIVDVSNTTQSPQGSTAHFVYSQLIKFINKYAARSVDGIYDNVQEMIDNQESQLENNIYLVLNASSDPNAPNDKAYYVYLGTTTESLTDYDLLSPEQVAEYLVPTLEEVTQSENITTAGIKAIDSQLGVFSSNEEESVVIDFDKIELTKNGKKISITPALITTDRNIIIPDKSGTLVLRVNDEAADNDGNIQLNLSINNGELSITGGDTVNLDKQIKSLNYVFESSSGGTGTEDGANAWHKVATFNFTSNFTEHTQILHFTGKEFQSVGSALVGFTARRRSGLSDIYISIDILSMTSSVVFSEDGFKLVSDSSDVIELWIKKSTNNTRIYAYDLGYNDGNSTVVWESNTGWQSAEPTGTFEAQSNGLTYMSQKVYHEGNLKEENISGTRRDETGVSGTVTIDWDAEKTVVIDTTNAITITDTNLPQGSNTKVMEMLVKATGFTVPAYWEQMPSSDSFDTTVRNHIMVTCINGNSGHEIVLYNIVKLNS